jgi:hypothetical protein
MVVDNDVFLIWVATDLADLGEVGRIRVSAEVDFILVVVEHGDEVLQEYGAEAEEVLIGRHALDAKNTVATKVDHISARLKLNLAASQHNLDGLHVVCKLLASSGRNRTLDH